MIALRILIQILKLITKPKRQTDLDTNIIACRMLVESGNFLDDNVLITYPIIESNWSKQEIYTMCHSALLRILLFSANHIWKDQILAQKYEKRIEILFPDAMMFLNQMTEVQQINFPNGLFKSVGSNNKKLTMISFVAFWLATTLLVHGEKEDVSSLTQILTRSLIASRV